MPSGGSSPWLLHSKHFSLVESLQSLKFVQKIDGLLETSPGVRSCMVEYDQTVLPLRTLLNILLTTESKLPMVRP